jgi:hypothetical protein
MSYLETERRVDEFVQYLWDFYDVNQEWPTRKDYANFIGYDQHRSLPGVRAAINRGMVCYEPGDHLVPRYIAERLQAERVAHSTGDRPQ